MRNIITLILNKWDAMAILPEFLSHTYKSSYRAVGVSEQLEQYFDALRDDIYVCIEFPYVDKFYRNSYYTYFASKHHEYPKDCVRLAFFDQEIHEGDFRSLEGMSKLKDAFLGFLVLRPTFPNIIGRSVVSPKALRDGNFRCCTMQDEIMFNGVKLIAKGYPHSTQDTETISCAETTIWNVMQYFGTKYSEYSPVQPSDIIGALAAYSAERQLPSHGLMATDISYALKKFGFGVRIYSSEAHEDLRQIFNYYVDSGIPVIVALTNSLVGHAVVYIGYENLSDASRATIGNLNPSYILKGGKLKVVDFSDLEKKHIVIDDNYPPYQKAHFSSPTAYYTDPRFVDCKPVSLIVPLYARVHMEALEARKLVLSLLADATLLSNITEVQDEGKTIILRLFITSSRSYKSGAALNQKMSPSLKEIIINTAMPRFIWVAEISDELNFVNQECSGVILIDATSAHAERDAVILIAYPNVMFVQHNGEPTKLDLRTDPFDMYQDNLQGAI